MESAHHVLKQHVTRKAQLFPALVEKLPQLSLSGLSSAAASPEIWLEREPEGGRKLISKLLDWVGRKVPQSLQMASFAGNANPSRGGKKPGQRRRIRAERTKTSEQRESDTERENSNETCKFVAFSHSPSLSLLKPACIHTHPHPHPQ